MDFTAFLNIHFQVLSFLGFFVQYFKKKNTKMMKLEINSFEKCHSEYSLKLESIVIRPQVATRFLLQLLVPPEFYTFSPH